MRVHMRRVGFTLIEMLVVLIVVLALSAMLTLAILRMGDKNLVPEGAKTVQGMLAQARTRALAEKRGVGVRFLVMLPPASNPALNPNPPAFPAFDSTFSSGMVLIDQLQFVHDPGDFTDGWVETVNVHPVTGAALTPTDRLWNRVVAGPSAPGVPYFGFTFTDITTPRTGPVLPGDRVEFHGGGQLDRVHPADAVSLAFLNRPADAVDNFLAPPSPALTRTVYAASPVPSAALETASGRTMFILERRLDHPIQLSPLMVARPPRVNYRILRAPRPIPGEAAMSMPRDVAIIGRDLTGFYFNPPANTLARQCNPFLTPTDVARGYVEIMFEPSGRVMGAAAEAIYLFVADSASARIDPATTAPNDTNWAIVAIYTRTGAIAVFPVDQVSGNPYSFAQLGRGTGM